MIKRCNFKVIVKELRSFPLKIVAFEFSGFAMFLMYRFVINFWTTQEGYSTFSWWWLIVLVVGCGVTVGLAKYREHKSLGAAGPAAVLWVLALFLLSVYQFEIHPIGYFWLIVAGFTLWLLLFSEEFTHVEQVVAHAEESLHESSSDRIAILALLSDQCKFYHDRVLAGIVGVVTVYGACLTVISSTADGRPAWVSSMMSVDILMPAAFIAAGLARYLALPMINLLYRIRCKAVGFTPEGSAQKEKEVPVEQGTKEAP